MSDSDKTSTNELTHFGVKGMKWGVHKSAVAVGRTSKKAVLKVRDAAVYAAHHKRMVVGAVIAARLLYVAGATVLHVGGTGILLRASANRRDAYRAGKFAAKAIASTAAKVNYAKMVRGAYKITTM